MNLQTPHPRLAITADQRADIIRELGHNPDSATILTVAVKYDVPVAYVCAVAR